MNQVAQLIDQLDERFKHEDEAKRNIVKAVGQFVREQLEPLRQRIAELEGEVELLKAGGIKYMGVWQPGTYLRGQLITSGGSLWHCNRETVSRPGDSGNDWTLCVKRGKDAA